MSFQLRLHEDHTTGLVATCDVCGCLITDASMANLCWNGFFDAKGADLHRQDDKPGDFFRYRITCKDECTHRLDCELGHQFTTQLDVAIGYLMNNCRVDYKKMRHTMRLLTMFS